jgi:hypothetical protein
MFPRKNRLMRGNLVAQTAGLRRAELDVLRPVTPAANGPANARCGRLRSVADGTSPSVISLAEHRVEFGVGPDRPDLLRAAAGGGDLGSPLQRVLA